jgi:hypothetical protein
MLGVRVCMRLWSMFVLVHTPGIYCAGVAGAGTGGVFNPAMGIGLSVASAIKGSHAAMDVWMYIVRACAYLCAALVCLGARIGKCGLGWVDAVVLFVVFNAPRCGCEAVCIRVCGTTTSRADEVGEPALNRVGCCYPSARLARTCCVLDVLHAGGSHLWHHHLRGYL